MNRSTCWWDKKAGVCFGGIRDDTLEREDRGRLCPMELIDFGFCSSMLFVSEDIQEGYEHDHTGNLLRMTRRWWAIC